MRIEADVKLDYKVQWWPTNVASRVCVCVRAHSAPPDCHMDLKDVLIRPKRSTLKSRADVNLDRTYTFLHSKKTWTGKAGVKEGVQTARVCVRTS